MERLYKGFKYIQNCFYPRNQQRQVTTCPVFPGILKLVEPYSLIVKTDDTKYLSKINLTFLEQTRISIVVICMLFPVPYPNYKIYFA
ncbi:hypothetical protein [Trichormus sp. NMC-1]|uniref:hypothetical protein n=1 Tax=Trichormus sp. NMC-1 TaxID=1853259 RepID=UPI0008DC15AB|nr:hypothetical protein [Trichormus sp. NMC-1]